MTDRFKDAADAIRNRVVLDNPEDEWKYLAIAIAPYQNTVLESLTIATEAEQLRKQNEIMRQERDELAKFICGQGFDSHAETTMIKERAKRIIENGNA